MKKLSLFSLVLVCTFFSCKKSNSGSSGYHVTAAVDGTNKAFNVSPLATKVTNLGYTLIGIEGFSSTNQSSMEVVSVSIDNSQSDKPIVAGTYTDTTSGFDVSIVYKTAGQSAQYVGTTSTADEASQAGTPVKNHVKIVITSIDATSVKGTFSGDAYFNADISGAKKTITNGDFYVKFQ